MQGPLGLSSTNKHKPIIIQSIIVHTGRSNAANWTSMVAMWGITDICRPTAKPTVHGPGPLHRDLPHLAAEIISMLRGRE